MGGHVKILFKTFVISSIILVQSAQASLRMPVFATELLKTASVANLFGQNFIFKNEDPQAQSRPIWILAGDSLSSGWANKDSLLELYQTASRRPLQRAGSAFDLLQHLPSSATTWFAGSSFHYGVFGFLSPEWANRPDPNVYPEWVLVATSYAGAVLMPEYSKNTDAKDPVQLIKEVENPERAHLLTMSIGANDTCQGIDSVRYQSQVEAKLKGLKNHFRSRKMDYAFWRVPEVENVHSRIMKVLQALPERNSSEINAKNRLINYCDTAWRRYCPAVFENPAGIQRNRNNLNRLYAKYFGPTFDAGIDHLNDFSNQEVMFMLSSDCFHPSRSGHKWISDRMSRYLRAKGVAFR